MLTGEQNVSRPRDQWSHAADFERRNGERRATEREELAMFSWTVLDQIVKEHVF